MTIRTVTNPTTPLGDVLRDATPDGVLVQGEGQAQFAIIPLDDDLVDYLLERSPKLAEDCRRIRQRMHDSHFHTHASVKELLKGE